MSKLTEAQEKFGALHKRMGEVLKQAGADHDFAKVTVFGEDLDTQAKVEKFRALNQELADSAEECKRLELQQAGANWDKFETDIKRPAKSVAHPDGASTKSIGQRLTESEQYQAFRKDHARGFSIEFNDVSLKTLMSTVAGYAPESMRIGRIIEDAQRPVQILDLIPMTGTNQSAIKYMEETTFTSNAAETLEAASYKEAAFEFTERMSPVRKLTNSLPVTDEQLDDEPQLRGYIDQRLRFQIRQKLDAQVIVGTGTPPALRGITQVTGIQTQAKGTDPRFDAIHKAITKVRVTGRAFPNAIVLESNDWQDIRLTRTADGIYILGNPAVAGPMTLFGLPVTLCDSLTTGTGLVGDFANFCQLHERSGISIQVGYSGTQFAEGKQLLRADLRVAFVVYRPAAFCTVTGL